MVTVITLNVQAGDRKTTLGTSSKRGRKKLQRTIEKKLQEGAAVFVEFMGETFRIKRYDPKNDQLVVQAKRVSKGARTFRINAADAVITVVAPMAGG